MIETLVPAVVALVAPFLGKAGEEAAKTVGKEAATSGLKMLGWLRDKTTGRAKEALEDAEKQPTDINKADLHKQLAKLLGENPALLAELQAMLPKAEARAEGQSQTVGDHGVGIQSKGDRNTISVTR